MSNQKTTSEQSASNREGSSGSSCNDLLSGDVAILAERIYPGLKNSGICSRHRDDGHFECVTCYPNWRRLVSDHMEALDKLYDELLDLSGLTDPPTGRIGTRRIIEELSRKIEAR